MNLRPRPIANHPKKVLIADDSENDRFLFTLALRPHGEFEVGGMTCNGIDTINYLNAVAPYSEGSPHAYPDLLLLDYQMPDGTGLEVLSWLQGQARRPKVVLWSHAVEQIDYACAYGLGANLVCAKPGTRSETVATIYRALAAPLQRDHSAAQTPLREMCFV